MNTEFQFEQITAADFLEIEMLALKNGGNSNLTTTVLNHQYLNNPSKSFSLWKVVRGNKIEGYATTNNFNFILENKRMIISMPQNVLVTEAARGGGLFGKLYNLTEKQNRGDNGINTFLTFTNKMSTPIFLKKFGYVKGQCPDLIFYISSFKFLKKEISYKVLKSVSEINFENFNDVTQLNNALIKDKQYFYWRYKLYGAKSLRILEVSKENKNIGFVILKVEKKKGVSFLLVMDIIANNGDCVFDIINVCRHYCSKNLFAGLLLFKLTDVEYPKSILKLTFRERFNFLVKGESETATVALSNIKFNFYLGDMDSF